MDNRNRELAYRGMSSLMLASLLLLAGCGSPSGPPGARPGMGPPGAPVVGGPPIASPAAGSASSKNVADSVAKSSDMVADNQDAKSPGLPGMVPGAPVKSSEDGDSNADANGVNPMAPTSKVEQAGNEVSLASDIIFMKGNPFLDRLPKPIVAALTDPTAANPSATPAEAPPDPFASVSVLGIAYQAKSPMAIISVSGGETQTQMVRAGDVLMMDGGQIKVSSISQDSVVFQKLGTGGEKRTMSLPSLIGYSSAGTPGKADGSSSGSGGAAPKPPMSKAAAATQSATPDLDAIMSGLSGKAPAGGMGGAMGNLSNLKKLTQGSAGGAMKTPDVNLNEP